MVFCIQRTNTYKSNARLVVSPHHIRAILPLCGKHLLVLCFAILHSVFFLASVFLHGRGAELSLVPARLYTLSILRIMSCS